MKTIKIILICCSILLLSGCKNKSEEKVLTKEEVKQEMLDYITNKYHEEFEIHSIDYKSWYNGGVETMLLYPKGENPNYYFYVKRYDKGNIEDDYVSFIMSKIYDQKIKEVALKYFPDAVIKTGIPNSSPTPKSFMPDMDIKEFEKYANKEITLSCTVILVAETEEEIDQEKAKLLENDLKKINSIGVIHFLGYAPQEFETYVINDPFNTQEQHKNYSTRGLKVELDISWGEMDPNYKYDE